jgi:hypothetical protein
MRRLGKIWVGSAIVLAILFALVLLSLLVLGFLGLIWYLSPILSISSIPYVDLRTALSFTERKDFVWGFASVV